VEKSRWRRGEAYPQVAGRRIGQVGHGTAETLMVRVPKRDRQGGARGVFDATL
jgi:hypothetical protein